MTSQLHPMFDTIKVKVDPPDKYGFSNGESVAGESGVVVEISEFIAWIGFHSFAFEESFMDGSKLAEFAEKLIDRLHGKRVFWESFQDSGRRIKEGDNEFVFLKITDIIAYSDNVDVKAKTVNDARRAGSFQA